MRKSSISSLLILTTVGMLPVAHSDEKKTEWTLQLQERVKEEGQVKFRTVEKKVNWKPSETAIVIVDMWDDHHCPAAARRVVEMAPHMNRVIKAARDRGVLIVHAPSDCANFYKGTPQRKNAETAPNALSKVKFQWNPFNPKHEGPLAGRLERAGCACDTPQPCGRGRRAWTRQIAALEMDAKDAVSSSGREIYNLLEQRGIVNVTIMGVHTNVCVLGRPFGIRQMVYLGKNVVLCRDLTDSYHRDPGKHFEGLKQIVEHIEKYWCPTITSESISGEKPFRFKADKPK